MNKRIIASKTGRVLIGGASVLALVAATGPLAQSAGGDNAGPAAVAPDDAQVAKKDRWAVINADATINRGKGVTFVEQSGVGNYIVHFDKNVRACMYDATIGLSGASGTSSPGFITVVGAAIDVNGVFVTTDNTAGTSTNLGFHLYVGC